MAPKHKKRKLIVQDQLIVAGEDVTNKGMSLKTKKINLVASGILSGSVQDTGWDLPLTGYVLNVFLKVVTAEATGSTKTIDVGLLNAVESGVEDGFLNNVPVNTTGLKKGTLLSSGQTLGSYLRVDESGAGVLVPEPHVLNGVAKSVCWTMPAANWVEFVGELYIIYAEID